MNLSGPPVQQVAHYYRILCEDVLVIHDDIDLTFGRLKIKEKGGHGGHNGVRSLIDALGEGDFVRLRVGVGRSENGAGVVDHVLGRFNAEERAALADVITLARDAVVTILWKGTQEGMNRFNNTSVINSR
jgi:PTH1 family peptidyl-tRNA hydrolase